MKVSKMIAMLAAAILLLATGCASGADDGDLGSYRSIVILKHRLGVDSPGPDEMVAVLEDLKARLAATKLFDEVAYTCDFNHSKETMLITAKYVKASEGKPAGVYYTITNVVTEEVLATVECPGGDLKDVAGVNKKMVDFIVSHAKR